MERPKNIGVFGGTFNPPHAGHILTAQSAANDLGLDLLLFIPTGMPPHKELPERTPNPQERLQMLKIAVDGIPNTQVCDLELLREGKSYTVHTIRELRKQYPEATFWLMMGTDMFMTLESWYAHEDLLSMVNLVVLNRGEEQEMERNLSQAAHLNERYGVKAVCIGAPPLVVSSTDLRIALQNGTWNKYVFPSVYGYILRHHLYGVNKDLKNLNWEDLRALASSLLQAKRIPHVMGTERAAVSLSQRWGASEDDTRTAALLHDCTKRLTEEEQLKLCDKYGIVLDSLEQTTVKLIHARTGAALARELCGVSDAVYEAIRWHTTGRANMSLLEKIIYLADYIEETRDFEGVEQLRKLSYQDIDAAVCLGLQMTMEEMRSAGRPIHYRTVEAYNWLKGIENESK